LGIPGSCHTAERHNWMNYSNWTGKGLGFWSYEQIFFNKWLQRAQDLAEDERKLQASLSDHVRHVLKGKRLLLFRDLLLELDYPDKTLFDDIIGGFKLSGWIGIRGFLQAYLGHQNLPWKRY